MEALIRAFHGQHGGPLSDYQPSMITCGPMEIFEDPVWQMSLGERAAVEGVLAQLRPSLAIEIGSVEGACLRRIAAHATEVHSFDLQPPSLDAARQRHAAHRRFARAAAGVPGASWPSMGATSTSRSSTATTHRTGVRRDLEDLLDSAAVARRVILIHDTANERVRRAWTRCGLPAWPKVAHVELDWIPGQLFAEPALRNELWYGLGLVLVDSSRLAYLNGSVYEQRYHLPAHCWRRCASWCWRGSGFRRGVQSSPPVEAIELRKRLRRLSTRSSHVRARARRELSWARRCGSEPELTGARATRISRADRALEDIKGSASWKMTEPLRARQAASRPPQELSKRGLQLVRVALVSREVYPLGGGGIGQFVTAAARLLSTDRRGDDPHHLAVRGAYERLRAERDPRLPGEGVRVAFVPEPTVEEAAAWYHVMHCYGARVLRAAAGAVSGRRART